MRVWGADIVIERFDEAGRLQDTVRTRNTRLFPEESAAQEEAARRLQFYMKDMGIIWPNHTLRPVITTLWYEIATGFHYDSNSESGMSVQVGEHGGKNFVLILK